MMWVITRTQTPTSSQWTQINSYLKEFGLNTDGQLEKIDQSQCTAKVPNIPIPMAWHHKLSK